LLLFVGSSIHFDVLLRPLKVTVYFIISTFYSIIISMKPMVTAPEDNRNSFILKPLLDEVAEELIMCPQM
jgi:hypothetical protein